MRVKTDSKRSELLEAAADVFLEQGYERTQMAHVSDRAQCSKGTLYSYFASKEELFCKAVLAATSREAGVVSVRDRVHGAKPEAMLLEFGVGYLQTVYSPRFQLLRRLVFSATFDSAIGRAVYERAVKPYEEQASELLASAMRAGQLRVEDSRIAASHLCGLLESELLLKFLLQALDHPSPVRLRAAAKRAVAVFFAAYRQ